MALTAVGVVSAQCAAPACAPYSSVDYRGVAYVSTNKAGVCFYNDINSNDGCNPSSGSNDRWFFTDNTCVDSGCVNYCQHCNSTGGQCDLRRLGDLTVDCNTKDGCDCTTMAGFPEPQGGEIPEVNSSAIVVLIAVVAIGALALKKK